MIKNGSNVIFNIDVLDDYYDVRSMICTVVNKYNSDFDINIQRGTMWGNPYKDGTREENIERFRVYFIEKIKNKIITRDHLEVLRGMRLGCTCYPKQCHGDIIAHVVNTLFKDNILDNFFED